MDAYSLGNEVSFELKSGRAVELPPDHWITIDKHGDTWRSCDVMILATRASLAPGWQPFWGHLGGSGPKAYRPPPTGGWRRVGEVSQVLYTRPDQGGKYHLFEQGRRVELYSHASRQAWRLVLPDGCKVNRLGFEWP